MVCPICVGLPITKATSSSKSIRFEGPKVGTDASGGFIWPLGRTMSVPDTTMDEARPW
jgi:hypothetical protein